MRFRVLGRRAALAFLFLCATSACKKKEVPAAPALAPPPAPPAELLGELLVPRPSESWPTLQALFGSPVTFLPKAPELALGGWLSLSPLVSSSLDLRAPLVAVALAGAEPALVIGAHLESGPEFVAQLTTGSTPTHALKREGGLALLTALNSPQATPIAVQGDTLLIGPKTGLLRAGSYVARSLLPKASSRGPVTAAFSGAALRTLAVPALRALWQQRKGALQEAQRNAERDHGRPADFADPGVLLAGLGERLEATFSVLSSAQRLTLQLVPEPECLELVAQLLPQPSGAASEWARGMPLGAVDTLTALPARTILGVLLRRTAEPGARHLAEQVVSLFSSRLAASDERALRAALGALDEGRGNVQALGVLNDLNLVWRGDVADAATLRRGLELTLAAFTKPPLNEPVTTFLGRPGLSQSSVRVQSVEGPVQRALFRFAPSAAAESKAGRTVEVLSAVQSNRFLVVAASGTRAPLEEALAAERGVDSLATRPEVQRLLGRSPSAALLVYADLRRFALGAAGSSTVSAPLTLTLGQREGQPEFSLRASSGALRVLLARGLEP